MLGKSHVATVVTFANFVQLLDEWGKWHNIIELSGWFLGDADVVQEGENPDLQQAMGIRGLGPEPTLDGNDSGDSDNESV